MLQASRSCYSCARGLHLPTVHYSPFLRECLYEFGASSKEKAGA
jgi:hypothetical protein